MSSRSHHGRTRRQPVIHKHHGTPAQIGRWAAIPVNCFATFYFQGFPGYNDRNFFPGNVEVTNYPTVENSDPTSNRSHREFWLPGDAELADHQYIEGSVQSRLLQLRPELHLDPRP